MNLKHHADVSFPGMCRKSCIRLGRKDYILKYSEDEIERINLCSEKLGISLCNQLSLKTSSVSLVLYDEKLCLLSEKWDMEEDEQYFPLASFYEELLDSLETVPFTYHLFKKIVREKAPERYDDILFTFWGIFIVDFLICNSRSAGNIGFIHDGSIRMAPVFDCSTALESLDDHRYEDLLFPRSLMSFEKGETCMYSVLTQMEDFHKSIMIQRIKKSFNYKELERQIEFKEEIFMLDAIRYRFSKLFI